MPFNQGTIIIILVITRLNLMLLHLKYNYVITLCVKKVNKKH